MKPIRFSKTTTTLATAFLISLGSASSAKADWQTLGAYCESIYGAQLVTRCLNAIQGHFALSGDCPDGVVTATKTTADVAAEANCTTAEACEHVKAGTSTAPGEGSGCGSG